MNTTQAEQDQKFKEFLETQKTNNEVFKAGSILVSDLESLIQDAEKKISELKARKENQNKSLKKTDKSFLLVENNLKKEGSSFSWVFPPKENIREVDFVRIKLRIYFSNGDGKLVAQIWILFGETDSSIGQEFLFDVKQYEKLFSINRDSYDLNGKACFADYPESRASLPILNLKKFSDEEREKLFCLPQVRFAIKELGL